MMNIIRKAKDIPVRNECDVLVVGAGPAGYSAAFEAVRNNLSVVIFEKNEVGGTCLNRGCIPTKALLHSAELYRELKLHGEALGLTGVGGESYDMATYITGEEAVNYMAAAALAASALGFNSDFIVDGISNYEPQAQ